MSHGSACPSPTARFLKLYPDVPAKRRSTILRDLGLLVFALPTVLVLVFTVPPRVRQIRQLTAAAAALIDTHDPERRELLAMRAAFGLSYLTLLRYTRDPLGDLAAGRFDPPVAAALDDAGVRPSPNGAGDTFMPPG